MTDPEPNRPHLAGCTLLALHGLPRSGKTTWARARPHPVVCPDAVRYAVHGRRFLAAAEPLVWGVVRTMVRALFYAGHKTVALVACNGTRRRRDEWLSSDWRTLFVPVLTPAAVCRERAAAGGDAYILPVIDRMAAEWEPLQPDEPVYREPEGR